jgi:hypothetical protein
MAGIEGARDQRAGALQEHKRATVIGFGDLRCNARFRQKLGVLSPWRRGARHAHSVGGQLTHSPPFTQGCLRAAFPQSPDFVPRGRLDWAKARAPRTH